MDDFILHFRGCLWVHYRTGSNNGDMTNYLLGCLDEFCHLRTVIWLWDMDSPEGWWTAIRSVPRELPTTDRRVCPMQLFHLEQAQRDVRFIQFKICCCVQNFMKIGWFFTEIWRYIDFQNGGRPPSWNCFTTIQDHPRSLCCCMAAAACLSNFMSIWYTDLKIQLLEFFAYLAWNTYQAPKWRFWGTLDP